MIIVQYLVYKAGLHGCVAFKKLPCPFNYKTNDEIGSGQWAG